MIPDLSKPAWKKACVCALLAALVFAVFGKTLSYGFVYDDAFYLTDNKTVQKGLTVEGVRWAFTYGGIGHWHPVTWLTHMLDCQLYGPHLWGHHLTNVILHAAAAALLFLALCEMTGAFWRCAFVAAAWAIHPLRAESVAWISERKDVLSGVFFMLVLLAYVRCVRAPSMGRRVLVAVLFALGLMSKDMLVTLPCVLLLLDYWPLRRLDRNVLLGPQIVALLKEKIPLFALSLLSCVITFLVPEKVSAGHQIPLTLRLENALVSYCIYLRQSIWPTGLSANYPNPTHAFPAWEIVGALALLGGIKLAALALRKSQPWLITGWLWFTGMLVPVIGLVQISHYAHADRYTYLPQIGLWIAGTWAVYEAAAEWRHRTIALQTAAAVILFTLLPVTWRQVSFWRDDISLWTHALACNGDDYVAHNNLGFDLLENGDIPGALFHLQESTRLDPTFEKPHINLGTALERAGRLDEAMKQYYEVLRINPNYSEAHNKLGLALQQQGNIEQATAEFREAVRGNSKYSEAYYNLGNALLEQKKFDEAVDNFQAAARIDPGKAKNHTNLGNALAGAKRVDDAIAEFQEAIRIDPTEANAHYSLANALFGKGKGAEAIDEAQKALALQPDNVFFQNDLALMLSMAPDTSLRNGPKAVELATKANQSTGGNDPMMLRTLAAAYAETGDFPRAVETAQKALQLLQAHSDKNATALQRELNLYQAGRKFGSGR